MLNILGLLVQTPATIRHDNLLGARIERTYYHLYDPAGAHARPPTVRRGVTMKFAPAYPAPAADSSRSSADMASDAVGALLAALPGSAASVTALLHAQCTLDQQILRSPTLRIKHDHFRHAPQVMGIGQLGTAGIATALRLAAGPSVGTADGTVCISACDKWIAPFIRRWPDLVTFADAAGACLVAPCLVAPGATHHAAAVIEDVVTICRPPPYDFWTTAADRQRAWLAQAVCEAIVTLLARGPRPDALVIAGDGFADRMSRDIATLAGDRTGLPVYPLPDDATSMESSVESPMAFPVHLSSAAPLSAIARGIAAASRSGDALEMIVWTASLGGHCAALRLHCRPDAVRIPDGWVGGRASSDAAPPSETPSSPPPSNPPPSNPMSSNPMSSNLGNPQCHA